MATFDIVIVNDLSIILIDLDHGRTVTNDAGRILAEVNLQVPGGIGRRKVYYRDTNGRYDQLVASGEAFVGFAPCTEAQQAMLIDIVAGKAQV